LVYRNAHTRFGGIDPDSGIGHVGIYRADLLKAGVGKAHIGNCFYFKAGVSTNGMTTLIDLYPNAE
jgi:hypothetical protein